MSENRDRFVLVDKKFVSAQQFEKLQEEYTKLRRSVTEWKETTSKEVARLKQSGEEATTKICQLERTVKSLQEAAEKREEKKKKKQATGSVPNVSAAAAEPRGQVLETTEEKSPALVNTAAGSHARTYATTMQAPRAPLVASLANGCTPPVPTTTGTAPSNSAAAVSAGSVTVSNRNNTANASVVTENNSRKRSVIIRGVPSDKDRPDWNKQQEVAYLCEKTRLFSRQQLDQWTIVHLRYSSQSGPGSSGNIDHHNSVMRITLPSAEDVKQAFIRKKQCFRFLQLERVYVEEDKPLSVRRRESQQKQGAGQFQAMQEQLHRLTWQLQQQPQYSLASQPNHGPGPIARATPPLPPVMDEDGFEFQRGARNRGWNGLRRRR